MTNTNTNKREQCLRDAESYVKEHDIQRIVKECVVQLCIHRPDNPYSFLKQHFSTLEKVKVIKLYSKLVGITPLYLANWNKILYYRPLTPKRKIRCRKYT